MKVDFVIKSSPDTISVTADPAIIGDLICVFEFALSIAHEMKRKAKYESATAQEKRDKKAAFRRAEFEAEAIKIYRRFKELLENECKGSKPLAMQILKKEFKMGYTDVDIYIAEGRKALRKRQKEQLTTVSKSRQGKIQEKIKRKSVDLSCVEAI